MPLQVLAAPRRRQILRLIWDAERSAGEVCRAMPEISFGAVSQHLGILEQAGFVKRREAGRFHYYAAHKAGLGPLRKWLEAAWDDALARLRLHAELEEARRGPRPGRGGRPRERKPRRKMP